MNQSLSLPSAQLTDQERGILSAFQALDGGYSSQATPHPVRGPRSRVASQTSSAQMAWFGWAAGIIDGEGCIHLARPCGRSKLWDLQVIVVNTNRPMLEKLSQLFGGNISRPRADDTKRKPVYRWYVRGDGAVEALKRMRPWLVTKAAQADVAISSGRSRDPQILEAAKAELHRLNHRGRA